MTDNYNKILTTFNSITSEYTFIPDQSNVIVIDTSNNRIGINTLDPEESIHIKDGNIKGDSIFATTIVVKGDETSINNSDLFMSNLLVKGDASFNNDVEISNHLLVKNYAIFYKNVEISNNLLVIGDSSFNQNVEISNNLLVKGDVSFNQNLEISNNLLVKGDASFNQNVEISNHLLVKGDASFNNDVEISNNLILKGELHAPVEFIIDPQVIGNNTGKVIIKGDLEVLGSQTTINSTTLDIGDNRITLNSLLSLTHGAGIDISINNTTKSFIYYHYGNKWTIDDASLNIDGRLEVIKDASFNNDLEITKNLLVKGDASFNNHLEISNHLLVKGDASFNQNVEISNLLVKGDIKINDISIKQKILNLLNNLDDYPDISRVLHNAAETVTASATGYAGKLAEKGEQGYKGFRGSQGPPGNNGTSTDAYDKRTKQQHHINRTRSKIIDIMNYYWNKFEPDGDNRLRAQVNNNYGLIKRFFQMYEV